MDPIKDKSQTVATILIPDGQSDLEYLSEKRCYDKIKNRNPINYSWKEKK
jgi:hypothetical protein